MGEYITEDQFLNLLVERLHGTPGIELDAQTDHVAGNLADIAVLILAVHSEHGPVLFGD
ncbi:hypothetical protein [Actinoplanes rectilineatus]|uniref:hypothetical protein n=1 Tax=Actinoplanes rectilineatus TaxID=113571 RepID=UPI000B32D664|nr:hypothetical protein [Actinoplanes rectilineatus]